MFSEFLLTKIENPGVHSQVMWREDLLAQLDSIRIRRVAAVIAPSGYGKSTLLASFFQRLKSAGERCAWYSTDQFDNYNLNFWLYAAAALRQAGLPLDLHTFRELIGSIPQGSFGYIHPLINQVVEYGQSLYLFIDDLQMITDRETIEGLSYLIEHQPDNLHLILASRSELTIPLNRLTAQRQVLKLSRADLAFTHAEVQTYMDTVQHLTLTGAEINSLHHFSEGWAIGLQLAALAYRQPAGGAGIPSSGEMLRSSIFDYFNEVVISQLSVELRTFLRRCSVLDELTPAVCNQLCECQNAADLLGELVKANLFISALENCNGYRLHPLFAEALQTHLAQSDPGQVSEIHKRASILYLNGGNVETAIFHARASNDLDFTADILDSVALQSLIRMDNASVARLLSHFSDEVIYHRPQLGIYCIMFAVRYGINEQVRERIRVVQQALSAALDRVLSPSKTNFVRWELQAINTASLIKNIHTPESIETFLEIIRTTPSEDTFFYGALCHSLACEYEMMGNFEATLEYFRKGLSFADTRSFFPEAVITHCKIAEVHRIMGNLAEAERVYNEALAYATLHQVRTIMPYTGLLDVALCRQNKPVSARWADAIRADLDRIELNPTVEAEFATACLFLGGYELDGGNFSASAFYLGRASQELQVQKSNSGYLLVRLALYCERLSRSADASELAGRNLDSVDQLPDYGLFHTATQIESARRLLAGGQHPQAFVLLAEVEQETKKFGAVEFLLECLILKSIALYETDRVEEGRRALIEAIDLARPAEYLIVFRSNIENLLPILGDCLVNWPCIQPGSQGELVKKFIEDIIALGPTPTATREDGIADFMRQIKDQDLLTGRELEVLMLLVRGNTRKQAAAALTVSLNTIKSHTKNIYRKLGSHNRAILYQYARRMGVDPLTWQEN